MDQFIVTVEKFHKQAYTLFKEMMLLSTVSQFMMLILLSVKVLKYNTIPWYGVFMPNILYITAIIPWYISYLPTDYSVYVKSCIISVLYLLILLPFILFVSWLDVQSVSPISFLWIFGVLGTVCCVRAIALQYDKLKCLNFNSAFKSFIYGAGFLVLLYLSQDKLLNDNMSYMHMWKPIQIMTLFYITTNDSCLSKKKQNHELVNNIHILSLTSIAWILVVVLPLYLDNNMDSVMFLFSLSVHVTLNILYTILLYRLEFNVYTRGIVKWLPFVITNNTATSSESNDLRLNPSFDFVL